MDLVSPGLESHPTVDGDLMLPADIGSTAELANVSLVLRSDLTFTLQQHGEKPCYLIEDEKNSRFYRIGIPEYSFISLLDGTTNVREALALTASQLGDDALTEQDAATICRWLIDSQLAQTDASRSTARLVHSSNKSSNRRRLQSMNPLFVRLPLLRPDDFLTYVEEWLGWWISWPAFVVWMAVVAFAIHQWVMHSSSLPPSASRVFAAGNLFWMALTWCLLKLAHEVSHGIACKRFGGNVREAGVMLIALAPIPYVDVTSAWRFRSKWQRIFVSAAGMYTEIFLAALATIVFIHASPGLVREQARNVMITGSLITLAFNANPLMRFDGYYILSDWIEIPNLYGLGQQFVQYLGRRYVMGVQTRLPVWPRWKTFFIGGYGLLTLFWRIVVMAGMLIAAATLFHGAGVVLAMAGGVLWIGLPTWKLIRYITVGNGRERPNRKRFAIVGSALVLFAIGLSRLPEPGGVRAPAIVAYQPLHIVRAPHAGFVRSIQTSDGERVERGQLLMVIENPELELEVADLELKQLESIFRSRQLRDAREIAASQVEQEIQSFLERRLNERRQQLNLSSIKAPTRGEILSRNVRSLLGSYVEEGDPLISIGNPDNKQLELSIDQQDVKSFESRAGNTVDVTFRADHSAAMSCSLLDVEPSASRHLEIAALAAPNGGPLSVKPTVKPTGGEDQRERETKGWELVEPRFTGHVELSRMQSHQVKAGQLATVRLRESRGTLAAFVFRSVSDWIERRWEQAR